MRGSVRGCPLSPSTLHRVQGTPETPLGDPSQGSREGGGAGCEELPPKPQGGWSLWEGRRCQGNSEPRGHLLFFSLHLVVWDLGDRCGYFYQEMQSQFARPAIYLRQLHTQYSSEKLRAQESSGTWGLVRGPGGSRSVWGCVPVMSAPGEAGAPPARVEPGDGRGGLGLGGSRGHTRD